MTRINAVRLVYAALLVAWLFDLLFWEESLGVNFPIITGLVLGVGLAGSRWAGTIPDRKTLPLAGIAIVLSFMVGFRAEPFSQFMGVASTVAILALSALSLTSGKWGLYEFRDFLEGLFGLVIGAVSQPLLVFNKLSQMEEPSRPQKAQWVFGLLRGTLLAVPALLVFASLLSSADPIFGDYLAQFTRWLRIENLAEYVFRICLIVLFGYLLAGVYYYSYTRDRDKDISLEGRGTPLPILGGMEAAAVLGLVNLLFGGFVLVQFRYFFGGHSSLYVYGYTYAEYARRGYAELILVAILSLALLIGLSSTVKQGTKRLTLTLSILSVSLILLLLVMLLSSFQRLLLYEAAYGFTRLRTYTHISIVWIAILLIAYACLSSRGRLRHLALLVFLSAVGFTATVEFINIDALIVRENIRRLEKSASLDEYYLMSLSADAIPELARQFQSATAHKDDIGVIIACHAASHSNYAATASWPGYNFSKLRARIAWELLQTDPDFDFAALSDEDRPGQNYVMLAGERIECRSAFLWD